MPIREKWLRTVAEVLKDLRPGDDEDTCFQRDAAEAHIRELLAAQPAAPDGPGELVVFEVAGGAALDHARSIIASQQACIAKIQEIVEEELGADSRSAEFDVLPSGVREAMVHFHERAAQRADAPFDWRAEGYVCAALHRVAIAGCVDCDRADAPVQAGALAELDEFLKELQHFGGAACHESEGKYEQDPDACQKCRLEQIIATLRPAASEGPEEHIPLIENADLLEAIQKYALGAGNKMGLQQFSQVVNYLNEKLLAVVKRERASRASGPAPQNDAERLPRDDYNEPLILAKQRMAIVERVMKLGYIKQTRDTEEGQIRFVARDDVITVVHNVAKVSRAADCGPHKDDNLAAQRQTDTGKEPK